MKIKYALNKHKTNNLTESDQPWLKRLLLTPVSRCVPKWYSSLKDRGTIKMCPSFANMFTNGFVVKLPVDMWVERTESGIKVDVSEGCEIDVFHTHGEEQFGPNFPFREGFAKVSVKFISYYVLKGEQPFDMFFQPCWWHPASNYIVAQPGLFRCDPKEPAIEYNINTYLKIPDEVGDKYVVPADTPICHIFFCHILTPTIERYSDKEFRRKESAGLEKRRMLGFSMFSKDYFDFLKSFRIRGR